MVYVLDSNKKIINVLDKPFPTQTNERFANAWNWLDDYYNETPTLEYIKAEKIKQLKAIRDEKEVKYVTYSGNVFDYDDKARERLKIARDCLTDTGQGSITWTTADNQRVQLSVADFAGINTAAAVRSNTLHCRYNELKILVNMAETAEEVEAIKWTD